MKKKSLLVLMVTAALLLTGCGKKKGGESEKQSESEPTISESTPVTPSESEPGESIPQESEPEESEPSEEEPSESEPGESESESTPAEVINHQAPFVTQITNPSTMREFNKDFDVMVEDFSSATPTGTTTGVFNDPFLRVLVDSEDVDEPTTPDAAIYKMATGSYQIQDYEGIGFTMRIAGSKQLKYSNLALGLRGDDAWDVYELKLSEALDPDQEELPALTEEYQDIIISPQQSLDAATEYTLKEGGAAGVKVLEKILGFHLYALDEECSAVLEIKEVFLYNAGEKTTLDVFDRADVGRQDPAVCYWRGSTGFIVRKGVTLAGGATYNTVNLASFAADYNYFVVTVMGDTTGATINGVAWANLKDQDGNAVSNAVNGAFVSLVIDPVNSELPFNEGNGVFASTTEVVISAFYMTNLQDEAPVVDYPKIDGYSASHFDLMTRKSEHIAATYEEGNSTVDEGVAADGLYYSIAYHNAQFTSVDEAIMIEGGDYDYVQITEGSAAEYHGYKYFVMAVLATDNVSGLRIAMPSASPAVYANQWLADAGLPSVPQDKENYVYNFGDTVYYIIDLERSGLTAADSIDIFYTGATSLTITSMFFANDYKEPLDEELAFEKTIAADVGYEYGGQFVSPADSRYLLFVFDTDTEYTVDQVRLQGFDGAKWFHDNQYIDDEGEVIPQTSGDGKYVIDLVASRLKEEGKAQAIDVHLGNGGNTSPATIKFYNLVPTPKAEVLTEDVIETTITVGEGYMYGGGYTVPANVDYLLVETNAGVENEIRFGGANGDAWLKDGAIIDIDGNVVIDGSTRYIIDLVASGLKNKNEEQLVHLHTTKAAEEATVNISTCVRVHNGGYATTYEKTNVDLSGYNYLSTYSYYGIGRYAYFCFTTNDENVTLKSIRFEGVNGEAWFKDNVIYDIDGHVISGDTLINESLIIIVDLVASRLVEKGAASSFHIHAGGFDGSTGTINIEAGMYLESGSYEFLIFAAEMNRNI